MLGNLRRKDRVMDRADVEALLAREIVGRLGTADADGQPYITPMNFVYDPASSTVYIHCGRAVGHMQSNLQVNPKVCFEVDAPGAIIATGAYGCNTSQLFDSVVIFGRARFVEYDAEREHILRLFLTRYLDGLMPDRDYDPALNLFAATTCIAISVDVMTGKRRELPANIEQPASVKARMGCPIDGHAATS
jgi:uncharacterized protein